ncbi:AraC family transcriptional regulator [Paenibacillus sp. NEAU-GSW1]|uniref:helix-turn-helix transcriptional regulator n=1 Tax=Paenibacillus sp. NEAU-GSW1 TaxID=2682486 RepID=UPI0012E24144|nr:AraC family transcriptional regulator [Paenibacillus sp. NEAU-GSW1]MUT66947.1 AraC family transcriptional regulator [Paenibacillus sp. NEAU-GSW1]
MTYPKELREITPLEQKTYPFRVFLNEQQHVVKGQNILFLHWHEHFEIIVQRQGRAIFHIDSDPYEVCPGDVLFVPAGGLHVGYSLEDGKSSFVSIVFNGSLFKDWAHDPIHMQFVAPYLEDRRRLPVKPDLIEPLSAHYYSLINQLIDESLAKRPAYQLIVKSQLHLLLAQLARLFFNRQSAAEKGKDHSPNRERFKPLIEYIEERFAEPITIEQAAQQVSLSPYHFCKMFKKLTGRTFIEYVNVCRVNEAERLLRESDLSVTDIAGQIGCDNPNYFTKLFKQYKGITPSMCRKQD